ncbi:hydroxymethylbilane synthase [Sandaracinobacter neustonicus]|uniref:Porphobilinogen deaminase n=1 Tax=Sandaracinobacter neustonicus TaxID=1715348 RepID=A0A501XSQ0_9SPHN|nr:hydroxymethylbilane synthase [Sandaracinobacter neustonicus]TPE63698.1 hydroxymethylbilane synthase [Sandaracinobacter neustonicus]
MTSNSPLRLGTRGSPLALAQANLVAAALAGAGAHDVQIIPVQTMGDRVQDRPLAEIGGKALWTKELDRALIEGEIDLAVHSMKDVETRLAPGIALAAVLPRADPRDRLIGAATLADLPAGAVIGTSSPRRVAQLLHQRPDLQVVSLRGNVATRLQAIADGRVAATFLAAAGLDRLGIEAGAGLPLDEWLPAAAQGIVGMTCRAGDTDVAALLTMVNHAPSFAALRAERAVLEGLGGSCHTAVAAHAVPGDVMQLRADLFSPDGRDRIVASSSGSGDPRELGLALAAQLMARATPAILASLEQAAA